jgi:hypothetical protein
MEKGAGRGPDAFDEDEDEDEGLATEAGIPSLNFTPPRGFAPGLPPNVIFSGAAGAGAGCCCASGAATGGETGPDEGVGAEVGAGAGAGATAAGSARFAFHCSNFSRRFRAASSSSWGRLAAGPDPAATDDVVAAPAPAP